MKSFLCDTFRRYSTKLFVYDIFRKCGTVPFSRGRANKGFYTKPGRFRNFMKVSLFFTILFEGTVPNLCDAEEPIKVLYETLKVPKVYKGFVFPTIPFEGTVRNLFGSSGPKRVLHETWKIAKLYEGFAVFYDTS